MDLRFATGDDLVELSAEPDGDGWRVRLPDGAERRLTARRIDDGTLELAVDQGDAIRVIRVPFVRSDGAVRLSWAGVEWTFHPAAAGPAGVPEVRHSGQLLAPMVGVVAGVMAKEGDEVDEYQPILVVEAMKVMATLEAPFAGTLARLHVQAGQQVAHGELLAEVEPREDASA